MKIAIRVLPHGEGLPLPAYQTAGSAGMDLVAAITEDCALAPGARRLIPCGFACAIPEGFEGQVRPRSGLALKHGLSIPNAPGTIDADYRGEVGVVLINLGQEAFNVTRGMRVAQLVVARVERASWELVETLPETDRGGGGYGHTGH